MTSFEDLPLGAETVASLAAEGIESPTPFQAAAIPVIARGNDLLGRTGPGSGTMVAYGAPLLDRLEGGAGTPVCLILCTGVRQATELARSFARLCEGSGLRAAALAPNWNLPDRADFLFVPSDRISDLYDGSVTISGVKAVVLHDGDGVVSSIPPDRLETFLSELPGECQRIFCGLPFGAALQSVARRFTKHAVTLPAGQAAAARKTTGKAKAGRELNFTVVEREHGEGVLGLAAALLEDSGTVRHVLLYTASADHAADLGDFLAVHGYLSGPPGDETVPVWLSPGEDEAAREALGAMANADTVATVSCAVPNGGPSAQLRHGAGGPAWVLPAVRELGHLRDVAAAAGLTLKRVRPERPRRVAARLDALADMLHEAVRAPGATPYYLLVESLLGRFTAAEVAAGALLLLDRDGAAKATGTGAAKRVRGSASANASAPEPWTRLFVSAGRRDEIGPGELLGAITNESQIQGSRVGRIDVRESHSLVEVRESDARNVIAALNGTTLGGRALRVDYDRPKEQRPQGQAPPRGKGPAGGPSRPPFRPGASGTSGRGKRPPPRTGRS